MASVCWYSAMKAADEQGTVSLMKYSMAQEVSAFQFTSFETLLLICSQPVSDF